MARHGAKRPRTMDLDLSEAEGWRLQAWPVNGSIPQVAMTPVAPAVPQRAATRGCQRPSRASQHHVPDHVARALVIAKGDRS